VRSAVPAVGEMSPSALSKYPRRDETMAACHGRLAQRSRSLHQPSTRCLRPLLQQFPSPYLYRFKCCGGSLQVYENKVICSGHLYYEDGLGMYEGVSRSCRTESITKYTLTTINTR
jgi:hypothetical protein